MSTNQRSNRQRTDGREPSEETTYRPAPTRIKEGQPTAEYFDQISGTDVERDLISGMEFLMSQDYVLGYIKESDRHELKWLGRTMADRIIASYPHKKSNLQGSYRAIVLEEPDNTKRALTRDQKEMIRQIFWSFLVRLSRSMEGKQQEWLSEVHQVVERRNDDSGGSRWNILS